MIIGVRRKDGGRSAAPPTWTSARLVLRGSTRPGRALVVALIAVLTAWSALQVASATEMSLEMAALAPDSDAVMNMADCPGCDSPETGNKANPLCELVCVAPVLADLTSSQEFTPAPLEAAHHAGPICAHVGRTDPPDPYPPRPVLLI